MFCYVNPGWTITENSVHQVCRPRLLLPFLPLSHCRTRTGGAAQTLSVPPGKPSEPKRSLQFIPFQLLTRPAGPRSDVHPYQHTRHHGSLHSHVDLG